MDKKNDYKEKDENVDDVIFEPEEEFKSDKKDSKLKEEIKKLKKDKKEYLDGWQRARAEMANLKKQHSEEKKIFTSLGKEALLTDIFPILDNFEAAFSNKKAWEKVDENWRVGIEYIYNQFKEVLKNNGIEEIGKVGEKFDENMHSATENIKTENEEQDHTIAEVIQTGYKLGKKIIREAKVKVFEF